MPRIECPICGDAWLDDDIACVKRKLEAIRNPVSIEDIRDRWGNPIHFSRMERLFLNAMLARGVNAVCSLDHLHDALYYDRASDPPLQVLTQWAYKVRRKLENHESPWRVDNAAREGYILRNTRPSAAPLATTAPGEKVACG